ncbi:LysE family translocator [Pseudoalteromonas obscura]|uniref:LysE family translocator n=1 Tax=Pseudoalteromonas obscura TaxID=3048491 RepID=A0ABT7EPG9_9GAMM|nr:LysE family translocator [Pseudoalteromonas sp. P94(2023)]MDK2596940.1 LysE family translocator [Pseudoalteromonas sp. P94(2023)]
MLMIMAMGLYAFSMSITPGPVNLIIFSGGLNRGVNATLPFIFGATMGFSVLLVTTGLGLGWVVQQHTWLVTICTLIGCAFMLYIAYGLFRTDGHIGAAKGSQAGLSAGFALMWLNPKAWLGAIAGNSLFIEPNQTAKLFVFVMVYALVCFICLTLWAVFGKQVSKHLVKEQSLRWLNKIAAVVLAGMCVLVLLELVNW